MYKKIYPKVIVVKKNIITIAIIIAGLIVSLILHNLFADNKNYRNHNNNQNTVQTVANESDISWYQNKEVKRIKTESYNKELNNKSTSININEAKEDHLHSNADSNLNSRKNLNTISDDDLQKAMRAPITSNQLVDQTVINHVENNVAQNINNSPIPLIHDPNMQGEKKAFLNFQNKCGDDYLESSLKDPVTPFEIQAGTIIPGTLISGINSDLPGQIIGQVRSNVYDSVSGRYLLIPQGAKLIGIYDSQIAYGQERILIAWKRIIFPNGQSIDLQGMPGVDLSGFAGFHDVVNNHYGKIFASVLLMSVISVGAQLSQPQNINNPFQAPTIGQTMAESLGTQIMSVGTSITAKNLNIQPTLEIRPGFQFNIMITKDVVFPCQYKGNIAI